MIFRSTELFFFYFEASFLFSYLSSMSCRILKLFFFYFEASFLLSYLSSKIFEMFSFYFEESFLLSYLYYSFNLFWLSQGSGVCLLKSSSIAFALIGFSINLQNFFQKQIVYFSDGLDPKKTITSWFPHVGVSILSRINC